MENLKSNQSMENQPGTLHKIIASTTLKMIITGFITLVLLIPMTYINDLIRERQNRKEEVIAQIDREWGNEVEIYGPIMKIPYKTYKKVINYDRKGNKHETREFDEYSYIFVYPKQLNLDTKVHSIPKKRGIYQTVVYQSEAKITGSFKQPDYKSLHIDPREIDWQKAKVLFFTTNNKGIQEKIKFDTGGTDKAVFSLTENTYKNLKKYVQFETTAFEKNPFENKQLLPYQMDYKVKGSQKYHVIPIANVTTLHLTSNWTNVKFEGEFLPGNNDKVLPDGKGIDAHWKVIEYQRPFNDVYIDKLPNFTNYSFGTKYLVSVDEYLKSKRTTKYAYLIIFLTFLVFFIIEKIGKVNMHAFQYFLIGLALVIFYTLLISISEHINFNTAYWIAGLATITLIGLYSKAILNSRKFSIYIFTVLSLLYTYIFVIIQMENYALLVGSIGLFFILAAIMFTSRKIKWS